MLYVRAVYDQACRCATLICDMISSPRAPARRRAYGSRKTGFGCSVSQARYIATQSAVSEMLRIRGSVVMVLRFVVFVSFSLRYLRIGFSSLAVARRSRRQVHGCFAVSGTPLPSRRRRHE